MTVDNNDTTTTTNNNISKSDIINALWKGDIITPNLPPSSDNPYSLFRRITIVISHCNEDLRWISHLVTEESLNVSKINVTIYTKCQSYDHSLVGTTLTNVHVESVPYVSGSPHAYAYAHWMARYTTTNPKNDYDDEVVVFLTGQTLDGHTTTNHHHDSSTRSLSDVLRITHLNGFGCLHKPSRYRSNDADLSVYHDTSLLLSFSKKSLSKNDAKNMTEWLSIVNATLPHPLTPVCYGEAFAVRSSLIKQKGLEFWKGVEGRLYRSKGVSTYEGHYAERLWAGLFRSKVDEGMIRDYATGRSEDDPYRGVLLRHEVITNRRTDAGDGLSSRRKSLMEMNEEAWRGGAITIDASSSLDDNDQISS